MRGTRRNAKSDRSKPALLGVRGLRRGGARCPGITSGKGHPDMRRSHPPPCARWPGTPGPGWLTTALGFWSGRALATGTALVGLCLIHHHHARPRQHRVDRPAILWSAAAECSQHPNTHPAPCARWPCDSQGPSGPGWLAIALGFWSGRALPTGTAWAGLCPIHHHHHHHHQPTPEHPPTGTPQGRITLQNGVKTVARGRPKAPSRSLGQAAAGSNQYWYMAVRRRASGALPGSYDPSNLVSAWLIGRAPSSSRRT